MRVRPLADHARRPAGDQLQALPDNDGHQEAQGPEGGSARPVELPRQVVKACTNLKLVFKLRIISS